MGKHEYIRIKLMVYVRCLTIHIGMIFNNIKLTLNRKKDTCSGLFNKREGNGIRADDGKFTHLVVGN